MNNMKHLIHILYLPIIIVMFYIMVHIYQFVRHNNKLILELGQDYALIPITKEDE